MHSTTEMEGKDENEEDYREEELKYFYHDLCASAMCEPSFGLDGESFRDAIIEIGIGCSSRSAGSFCTKHGEDGTILEEHFLRMMHPWTLTFKTVSIKDNLQKALSAFICGSATPKVKPLPKKIPTPLLQLSSMPECDVLSSFFLETSDLLDDDFTFPEHHDNNIIPRDVDFTFQREFDLPFTFDCCIKLFLLQKCYYSSVQHALKNRMSEPKLTPWTFEDPWFHRKFTCIAKIIELPSHLKKYIPLSVSKKCTIEFEIISRMKRLKAGAQVYHFRSEARDMPGGQLFYLHEIWEIRQINGCCKVRYLTGIEWRRKLSWSTTWIRPTLSRLVIPGARKATNIYIDTILQKFNELPGNGTDLPFLELENLKPRRIPLAAIYSLPAFLLFVEFCFPAMDLLGKLCVFLTAFSVLAVGVRQI